MTDTRKAAFDDAKLRRRELKARCLSALQGAALTADEIAAQIGEDVLSVRPRITELLRDGLVVKTVLRRANKSGKKAIVWTTK